MSRLTSLLVGVNNLMEYQLVCYNGVPLADAAHTTNSYRDITLSIIGTINLDDTPMGARKSFTSPDGIVLHLDLRRPFVCGLVCRAGTCMGDVTNILNTMHAKVSMLHPPRYAFEHQHTLGQLLPSLCRQPSAPELHQHDCEQDIRFANEGGRHIVSGNPIPDCHDDTFDSLESDSSIFGTPTSWTRRRWLNRGCFSDTMSCYIISCLGLAFLTCVIVFLGVGVWLYWHDFKY